MSDFVNPVLNPSARLGVQAFDERGIVFVPHESLSTEDFEIVIRAVYQQVLGNAHVMDSERLTIPESLLKNGDVTVREFVRAVAKSGFYRNRFFEGCSHNRFIELNFKHLLGRSPQGYDDFATHGRILTESGYDAEIDSYIGSDEYMAVFGENTVPYYRGYKTQTGQGVVGFTHMFRLLRGTAASDGYGVAAQLNRLVLKALPSRITPPLTAPHPWQRPVLSPDPRGIYTPPVPPKALKSLQPAISDNSYNDVSRPFNGETLPQYRQYQSFKAIDKVEWIGQNEGDFERVINTVYRQVLGNAHVMESERLVEAEAQLRSGLLDVREFVRAVALSDLYKSRFFDNLSNNRFIELNFKHLLGRAPTGYEDFAYHGRLITQDGYAAEINSYIDSDEYSATFGNDIVPYYQGYGSPTGQKLVGFTHMFALLRGNASSDKVCGGVAQVGSNALVEQSSQIVPPSTPDSAWMPKERGSLVVSDIQRLVNKALNIPETLVDVKGMVKEEPVPSVSETVVDLDRYQQYQGYQSFENTPVFELIPGQWESDDDFNTVVRAVYRQVLGNAYVMESERLTVAESQLKGGEISVREFVRQVAKSELYRSRFFTPCYRYRAIELNFKHLLGRAPDNYQEMIPHSNILDHEGYEADIDSYLDSDEYQSAFGENIVPYYRYKTRSGQSMLGFTNMFGLLASASSSDKDPKTNNAPRVMTALMLNNPYGATKPTDVRSLAENAVKQTSPALSIITTQSYSVDERQELSAKVQEQEEMIACLEKRLSELKTMAGLGEIALNRPLTGEVVLDTSSTASIIAMFPKDDLEELKEKVAVQAEQIKRLEGKIFEARSLSSVAEYQLNSWKQRSY